MHTVFSEILKQHMDRYPLMEPQDYGKLAFQSEFGAEHLAADRQTVLNYILEERKNLPAGSSLQDPEDIGGGLCRFPLSACQTETEAELLADLFIRTADRSFGTIDGLFEKMNQIAEYRIPGMQEWFAAWKEKGCPPVHHSQTYRSAYHPHYRLLKKDFAVYFPALREIGRLIKTGKTVLIGIDGRCGSGKTHFAELVGSLFPCNVIHMDDFYLPMERRQEDWKKIPGGNMDFERLYREVLMPVRRGKQVWYRPYDCSRGRLGEARLLSERSLTVLEGSYSHHPKLLAEYDRKIFLTCRRDEQARRLKEREGGYYAMFMEQWIPMEEKYFWYCAVEKGSDLRIDTSDIFL